MDPEVAGSRPVTHPIINPDNTNLICWRQTVIIWSCRAWHGRVMRMPRLVAAMLFIGMVGLWPPPLAAADEPTPTLGSIRIDPSLFTAQVISQGPETPPRTPERTGFSALWHTTIDDFKALPRRKSTWVILGIGAGSALLVHPADDSVNAHLGGSTAAKHFFAAGKVIGSAPVEIAGSVGLYLVGRYVVPHKDGESRTNKWSHLGFDLVRAQIVSQVVIQGMKYAMRRDRPTGECCSFPSGHAAAAFASASVLERHLGYRAAWPTLLIASYVGMSRLADNRHFLSDVLMGSAIGIATGWTVVGRHGRSDYALLPSPLLRGFQVNLIRRTHETRASGRS